MRLLAGEGGAGGKEAGVTDKPRYSLSRRCGWLVGSAVLWWGVTHSISLSAALMAFVITHEVGHAVVIRHLGYRSRGWLVHPFGGFCDYAALPRRGQEEFLVTFGGPAGGFLWALAAWLIGLAGGSEWFTYAAGIAAEVNLFNLLPCPPLDGWLLMCCIPGSLGRGRWMRVTLAAIALGYWVVRWATAHEWAAGLATFLAALGVIGESDPSKPVTPPGPEAA